MSGSIPSWRGRTPALWWSRSCAGNDGRADRLQQPKRSLQFPPPRRGREKSSVLSGILLQLERRRESDLVLAARLLDCLAVGGLGDVGAELGQAAGRQGQDAAVARQDLEEATLAPNQGNGYAAPAEHPAMGSGMRLHGRVFLLVLGEDVFVGGDELLHEVPLHDLHVGDQPAAVLVSPVGAEADEIALAGDVGIKWEGAAGDRPVVPLAVPGALALDRAAAVVQLVDNLPGGGIVRLEAVPEVGARFQELVFRLVHHRHRMLGRAADRRAVVQGGAELAAIVA